MLGWFYARDHVLRLRGPELKYLLPNMEELRFIIGKGLPMGAQMLVISGAGLVMVGLVNREGLVTAAAYGATLQLWNYVQMPALAVGAAVSAMVAQNIGAAKWNRVTTITTENHTLVVLHRIGDPLPHGVIHTLHGTWEGRTDPAPLAGVTTRQA